VSEASPEAEPLVLLEDVRKGYASGRGRQLVLDGVSLEISAGELVVVLGPSGCGKTTLLNLVGGLDRTDSGTVRACGVDLTRATRPILTAYRARSVGMIFQFYNLLPTLTARENVVAGITVAGIPRPEAEERSRELLGRVGVGDLADRFPAELSGGEQQRVAIARALAKRPALVLADEPTGNLDEGSSSRVLALIRELNAETGATFMIVTHNPEMAAAAGRQVRLSGGRVAEQTPDAPSDRDDGMAR
jgi:putative ABC transport system ATP-binding protein